MHRTSASSSGYVCHTRASQQAVATGEADGLSECSSGRARKSVDTSARQSSCWCTESTREQEGRSKGSSRAHRIADYVQHILVLPHLAQRIRLRLDHLPRILPQPADMHMDALTWSSMT